ncbi:MAG: hypothetical protein U0R18_19030 [Mycobacterium sp.]|mgnify:FL=1
MSIAQFREDLKRARNRRRLYARINAMPSDSTVRNELLAIARRSEEVAR